MTPLTEYYALLFYHDWTYEYSDDHAIFKKGLEAQRKLQNIAKESPQHQHFYKAFQEYRLKGGPLPLSPSNN